MTVPISRSRSPHPHTQHSHARTDSLLRPAQTDKCTHLELVCVLVKSLMDHQAVALPISKRHKPHSKTTNGTHQKQGARLTPPPHPAHTHLELVGVLVSACVDLQALPLPRCRPKLHLLLPPSLPIAVHQVDALVLCAQESGIRNTSFPYFQLAVCRQEPGVLILLPLLRLVRHRCPPAECTNLTRAGTGNQYPGVPHCKVDLQIWSLRSVSSRSSLRCCSPRQSTGPEGDKRSIPANRLIKLGLMPVDCQ